MKKITLIVLSLFVTLAIANTCKAKNNLESSCELDVTPGDSSDPCVVANRVGFPEGEKWTLETDESACYDSWGDGSWDRADNLDTYFRCWDQDYVAQNCDLKTIMTKVSEDENYCSLGTHNGYQTAAILFQVEHVPTPRLFTNYSSVEYVENNNTFIDTIIKQPVTISIEAEQQIIFLDARSFFGTMSHSYGNADAAWKAALINDEIFKYPDVRVFQPDRFDYSDPNPLLSGKATILEGPKAPAIPMVIDDLGDRYAFVFKENTSSSTADGRSPRIVIRGWEVTPHEVGNQVVGSAKAFLRTEGNTDVVLTRVLIDGSIFTETIFSLSGGTGLNLCEKNPCQGLTVNLGGNLDPVVFEFRDVPTRSQTLRNMANGLHISYDKSISKNKHPMPLRIDKNGEEWIEPCNLIQTTQGCNVYNNNAYDTDCIKCAQDDLGEGCSPSNILGLEKACERPYLVFKPECREADNDGKQECTFDIFLDRSPIHLPEFKGAPKPIVYVIDAAGDRLWGDAPSDLSGARIRHDYLNLPLPPPE